MAPRVINLTDAGSEEPRLQLRKYQSCAAAILHQVLSLEISNYQDTFAILD